MENPTRGNATIAGRARSNRTLQNRLRVASQRIASGIHTLTNFAPMANCTSGLAYGSAGPTQGSGRCQRGSSRNGVGLAAAPRAGSMPSAVLGIATRQIVAPSGPASARGTLSSSLALRIDRAEPIDHIGRPVAPSSPSEGLRTTVAARPGEAGRTSRTGSRVPNDQSSVRSPRQACSCLPAPDGWSRVSSGSGMFAHLPGWLFTPAGGRRSVSPVRNSPSLAS